MKRKLITLLILSCLAVFIVGSLFFLARARDNRLNGFARKINHAVLQQIARDIAVEPIWKLVGIGNSTIYLGHKKYVQSIKEIDLDKGNISNITIGGGNFRNILLARADISVDSPFFYIRDNFVSKYFKGTVVDWEAKRYSMPKLQYDQSVANKSGNLIMRLYDSKDGIILGKANTNSDTLLLNKSLLKAKGDNFFSKDGLLIGDPQSGKIVYVYLYRNDFLVLDSNLHKQFAGKTIDTVSHPKIKLGSNGGDKVSMSLRAKKINRKACIWNNFLFIESGLKADNEKLEDFQRGVVIDVYDLDKKGMYIYSFYLNGDEDDNLKDFRVKGNLLVALYDRKVSIFRFR